MKCDEDGEVYASRVGQCSTHIILAHITPTSTLACLHKSYVRRMFAMYDANERLLRRLLPMTDPND